MREPGATGERRRGLDLLGLVLILLLLVVRLVHLGSDPPSNLATSNDVYTDPAQYTLFAEQFVRDGKFNPYDDQRHVFFVKSSVTAAATVVFGLFGSGFRQAQAVGLLFSFGGLVFFYLFLRRQFGVVAGLLFLGLVGFDFNQVFYGRLPFLEHAMFFWIALAAVVLSYGRGRLPAVVAGMALALGAFFGKVLGLIGVAPFAMVLARRAVGPSSDDQSEKRDWLWCGLGFLVVLTVWLFWCYLPSRGGVGGYLTEQALGLYGAPEALRSVRAFLYQFAFFGYESLLFPRMPLVALMAAAFLMARTWRTGGGRTWRERLAGLTEGELFLAAMIVAFFVALMIWNYRPFRYQMVLIYPLCGAAAVVLERLWRGGGKVAASRPGWVAAAAVFAVLIVIAAQATAGVAEVFSESDSLEGYLWPGVILAALGALLWRYRGRPLRRLAAGSWWRRPVAAVVVLVTVGQGAFGFFEWSRRATYTGRDNARELAQVLSDGAVLSGPFAPQLTQGGPLGAVIHMFGTAQADPGLFDRFPVTHLLLDGSNESLARRDYPALMGRALPVTVFQFGMKKVSLYRIAGQTRNRAASRYQPSDYERAVAAGLGGRAEEASQLLARFLSRHPDSPAGLESAAEQAIRRGEIDVAERAYEKAVEFSPANWHLHFQLAMFYRTRFGVSGDPRYKERALEAVEQALRLGPSVDKVRQAYDELRAVSFGH